MVGWWRFRTARGRHRALPVRAAPPPPSNPRLEPTPAQGDAHESVPTTAGVQLTFRDGSAVELALDDPRARAFRTLAGELVRLR